MHSHKAEVDRLQLHQERCADPVLHRDLNQYLFHAGPLHIIVENGCAMQSARVLSHALDQNIGQVIQRILFPLARNFQLLIYRSSVLTSQRQDFTFPDQYLSLIHI